MGINRYNYEEFFLLYADGELNLLETEMVDQFLQFHPDLKEELDILKDCKLIADIPVFFPKEKLYKQTIWDADNISEMQHNLLLLVDGELAEGFKKELEKNIEENPALRQEWNTLQQAKLPVETIAHPYKKPLYKERRIPKLGWLRWAAAAAVIFGTGWFVVGKNIIGNNTENSFVGKNTSVKNQLNTIIVAKPQAIDVENSDDNANETTNSNKSTAVEQTKEQNTKATVKTNQQPTQKIIEKVPANREIPEESPTTDITQDLATNDNSTVGVNNDRTSLITKKAFDNVENIAKVPTVAKIKAPRIGQPATLKAVKQSQNLADLQPEADDNEYVRIAGAKVKKQKIRSVFRGVFRGIGRTFSNSKVEAAPAMALNNE